MEKHKPMQDTTDQNPVETPTTLPTLTKITRSHTHTLFHTISTVSGLNKPSSSHSETLIKVMSISLRICSHSIMPVTVHRTGLTAEVRGT